MFFIINTRQSNGYQNKSHYFILLFVISRYKNKSARVKRVKLKTGRRRMSYRFIAYNKTMILYQNMFLLSLATVVFNTRAYHVSILLKLSRPSARLLFAFA